MCVSRMSVTSDMEMPEAASAARRAGSVLEGPGSTSATPPDACTTAVAMIRGRCSNMRSKYERREASVIMGEVSCRGSTAPERGDDGDEGRGGEQRQAAAPDPLFERVPAVRQEISDGAEGHRPRDGAAGVVDEEPSPRQAARPGQH